MSKKQTITDINKTFIKKNKNQITWYIVDGKEKNLGRLSSKIAYLLLGKNIKEYSKSQESNIKVIILNSKQIKVTGKKNKQKTYKSHSGKPGGLKTETFSKLQNRIPNRIIEHSIRGMLPKNKIGRQIFKNIKVYPDNQHPHEAQKPIKLDIK